MSTRIAAGFWILMLLLIGSGPGLASPSEPAVDWAELPENIWVKHSPREGKAVPQFGWEGSGAYDPVQKKWIHQGGHDGIPQGFGLFTYDVETGAWEQKFPNTSPPGSCCVDGANVFDVAQRRFVRFPGAALGHGWQWSRKVKMKSSPVWLYDPDSGRWTNMRPPPYKDAEKNSKAGLGSLNAGATYDPVHEVSLSFGGQGSGGDMNNLFVYDAYSNQLERLQGKNPPDPRDGHGITYDAWNDCLVVFGSQYASDEKTWIYKYETNAWEGLALDPHPPGRKGKTYSTIPKMAYDSLNGVSLCLVWDDATGVHQTWAFDGGARKWTEMKPAKEADPSMSRSRNLSFSRELNAFILELYGKDRGPEIWVYRYKKTDVIVHAAPQATLVTEPGKAILSWPAGPAGTKYKIARAPADKSWEAKYTQIGWSEENRLADEGLEAGKTYFYKVQSTAGTSIVRTQPRVLIQPVVSVLAADKIEVTWNEHPAKDIAGTNLYRGTASVATVKKGTPGAWKDNDPEYSEPEIVAVRDITNLVKLNDTPLKGTSFTDTKVDLTKKGAESGDYRYAVHAYIVRAVNRLGTESGPSPYALTIPSEPENVLVREASGSAEIKWDPSREKGVAGYRVYSVADQNVARITDEPIKETKFTHAGGKGMKRYLIVAVDALGQEGQPSSSAWYNKSYKGFYSGDWHQ